LRAQKTGSTSPPEAVWSREPRPDASLTDDTGLSKIFPEDDLDHVKTGGRPMNRLLRKHIDTVTLISLFVGGLLLHALDKWLHLLDSFWFQSTFHMFCDALTLGGILGLTVDWFLKRHLMRNVGSIFIGWALPDEIRNNIREASQTSLVRRNYRAEYTFKKRRNKLDVEVVEEWDVYNYGSASEEYAGHMAIDHVDNLSPDSIGCEITQNGRPSTIYSADKLKGYLEKKPTRDVYRLPKITIPSQDIEDRRIKPACRVKWQYCISKNTRDVVWTYSTLPTIHVTVRIHSNCGLQFEFDPDDRLEHAEGSSEWRMPILFMPHQQFRIRWRPELDTDEPER
jgi:hypothetical protein